MEIYSKIKEKIRAIASPNDEPVIFTAQVKSVTGSTCTIDIDGLELTDVSLRVIINDRKDSVMTIPKLGSYVLVADLSGGRKYRLAVIGCSEPQQLNITIEGENLLEALSDLIDEVASIIVVQGTSPNVPALEKIKQRLGKILV